MLVLLVHTETGRESVVNQSVLLHRSGAPGSKWKLARDQAHFCARSLPGFKGGSGLAASEHLEHSILSILRPDKKRYVNEIVSVSSRKQPKKNHTFQCCSTLNKCMYLRH